MTPLAAIETSAESGDRYAQFLAGFIFHYGCLVEPSLDVAQQWYEKSAQQGFVLAQYFLYKLKWKLNEKDDAIYWVTKAAEADYAPAQAVLGSYYLRSSQTAKDNEIGVRMMLAAADNGEFDAIANAALMYEEGSVVDFSSAKALAYLKKGAELGSSTCAQMLADRLLKEQASESELEEGFRWLWYAAEKGEPFAYMQLSQIYEFGLYGATADTNLANLFGELSKSRMPF